MKLVNAMVNFLYFVLVMLFSSFLVCVLNPATA